MAPVHYRPATGKGFHGQLPGIPDVGHQRWPGGLGEVDQRGSRGVHGVRPYFNWVRLVIRVHTDEPQDRFERLTRNVEYRCPVMNLFKSADVDVDVTWERVAP